MGCQKEIAETVIERGADYILALKGNHSEMLRQGRAALSHILSLPQSMSWRVGPTAGMKAVYVR